MSDDPAPVASAVDTLVDDFARFPATWGALLQMLDCPSTAFARFWRLFAGRETSSCLSDQSRAAATVAPSVSVANKLCAGDLFPMPLPFPEVDGTLSACTHRSQRKHMRSKLRLQARKWTNRLVCLFSYWNLGQKAFGLVHAVSQLKLTNVQKSYCEKLCEDLLRWVRLPTGADLLRSGGRLVFLGNSTQLMLCVPDDGAATTELLRPQFGMHRFEWADDPGVEFYLSHGEMIKVLRTSGFEIEDLIELRPPAQAEESRYPFVDLEWANRWPAEEAWIVRKR